MSAANLLAWLNFFVADVRDGLGPFLGVFLLQNGFGEAQIGLIGTLSHIAALVFGVPCGILVDKTTRKKELIAFFITLIVLACVFNFFFPSFIFTLLAQIFAALSGVFLAPAFAALTLGIMGVQGYALQCARNEAYKHAGTVFGATLGFVFAFYFGIASIFFITAALGGVSLIVLSFIKKDAIDDTVARGEIHSTNTQSVSVWALFADKRVLVLCLTMFCFHLSNAAMLPLLSQRAHAMGVDSSGAYAAATIIIAQSTMILVAFVCGRLMSEKSPRNSSDKGALNAGKIYFCLLFRPYRSGFYSGKFRWYRRYGAYSAFRRRRGWREWRCRSYRSGDELAWQRAYQRGFGFCADLWRTWRGFKRCCGRVFC